MAIAAGYRLNNIEYNLIIQYFYLYLKLFLRTNYEL